MQVSYRFFKEYPITRILIGKIMSARFKEIGSSVRVHKMVLALGDEFEVYTKLLKEKEELIKWEGDKVINGDEIKVEFDELYNHNFTLTHGPLKAEELKSIPDVSPREIELLEMISEPNAFDSLQ